LARTQSRTDRIPKAATKRVDWVRERLPKDHTIESLAQRSGMRPDTAIEVIEAGGGAPLAKPFAERLCLHLGADIDALFPRGFAPTERVDRDVPHDGDKRERWVFHFLLERGESWQSVARAYKVQPASLRAAVRNGKGPPEIKPAAQKIARLVRVKTRALYPHGFAEQQKLRRSDIPKDDHGRRAWIREQLSKRGFSIPALAEDMGANRDEITRMIRHGGSNSSLKPVARYIAFILELQLEDLFPAGFAASDHRLRVRDIPTGNAERKHWIQKALDQRGYTLTDAANHTAMWKGTVVQVVFDGGGRLTHQPIGEYIAEALGLPMEKLFPWGFSDTRHVVTTAIDPNQIPQTAAERHQWIHRALRERGSSWSDITRETGTSPTTVTNVVRRGGGRRASAAIGKAIADRLGAPVEDVFPAGFTPKHEQRRATSTPVGVT